MLSLRVPTQYWKANPVHRVMFQSTMPGISSPETIRATSESTENSSHLNDIRIHEETEDNKDQFGVNALNGETIQIQRFRFSLLKIIVAWSHDNVLASTKMAIPVKIIYINGVFDDILIATVIMCIINHINCLAI